MKNTSLLAGAGIASVGVVVGALLLWALGGKIRLVNGAPMAFVRPMMMMADTGYGTQGFTKFDVKALNDPGYMPETVKPPVQFNADSLTDASGVVFNFPQGQAFQNKKSVIVMYVADKNTDTTTNLGTVCQAPVSPFSQALVAYDGGWVLSTKALSTLKAKTPLTAVRLVGTTTNGNFPIDGYGLITNLGQSGVSGNLVVLYLSSAAGDSPLDTKPDLSNECKP